MSHSAGFHLGELGGGVDDDGGYTLTQTNQIAKKNPRTNQNNDSKQACPRRSCGSDQSGHPGLSFAALAGNSESQHQPASQSPGKMCKH